jgi:hypothetical protein
MRKSNTLALTVCGRLASALRGAAPQNAPACHRDTPGYVLNRHIPGFATRRGIRFSARFARFSITVHQHKPGQGVFSTLLIWKGEK